MVKQETNPMDYRMDPVMIEQLDWDRELPVAAMDAFCHFVNKEQITLMWSCRHDAEVIRKPCLQALVLRPSLAFREHRGRFDLIEEGNVGYMQKVYEDFTSKLLPEQWKVCFDTIWPMVFLDMDGGKLWAFAVVQIRSKLATLRWYFADQREDLIQMNMMHTSHLILAAWKRLFAGRPGIKEQLPEDLKKLQPTYTRGYDLHTVPQISSGAAICLGIANRVLRR